VAWLRASGLLVERITVWLARIGFLIIAACTFGLSFDAIRDVAQNTGAVDPSLAWIVPLAVDGMIVTATAVLWTESLSGRGWHMFPLAAIVGPAALSMWANIAHASGTSLLAQVLAAVPPAGLILSLELVSWQIRRERTMAPRFTPAWLDRDRRSTARAEEGPGHDDVDDVSLRASRAVAEYDRQASRVDRPASAASDYAGTFVGRAGHDRVDHVQPDRAAHDGRVRDGDSRATDPYDEREIIATGRSAPRSDDSATTTGQLQIDRDDTGRLTLDVPNQGRGKEVWTQIIAAVQESGEVPTQRQLADDLDVPRSRVRRAIARNRDEWDDLCERVGQQGEPVGAGDRG
jgi:hypothetical protein